MSVIKVKENGKWRIVRVSDETISDAVSAHNVNVNAHSDIRDEISVLRDQHAEDKEDFQQAITDISDAVESIEIPIFDLVAMGLPDITLDGLDVTASCDTSEMIAAIKNGPIIVKSNVLIEQNPVEHMSIINTSWLPTTDGSAYQSVYLEHFGGQYYVAKLSVFDGHITACASAIQSIPPYTEDDYGKILSSTADGLAWIDAPSFDEILSAEGVQF